MTNLKATSPRRELTRKVVFTYSQMVQARLSPMFRFEEYGHRDFVAWLFREQHKMVILDHTKLRYNYEVRGQVTVEGVIGYSISAA